jgi:hypothetical protein
MRKQIAHPFQEVTEGSYSLLLTAKISKRTMTVWIEVKVWVIVQILSDHNIA